jgi:trans-aconitate methyltransferase
MNALSSDRSFSLEYIVKGYDWAALGKATVVDLGGGVGWVSRSLAKAFPLLDFVVQDWASVIANAAVEDPEIKDRIRFMEHDIVAEQPIKNADVYFMRRVLMEKTDAECVEVFKALKPALKKDAVILVQDPMVHTSYDAAVRYFTNRSGLLGPRTRNMSDMARTPVSRIGHSCACDNEKHA